MKKFTKSFVAVLFMLCILLTSIVPAFAASVPTVKKPKATANGTSVSLSWSSVSGASGYEIQQAKGSTWATLGDSLSTSYKVSSLKVGSTYKFRVRAYKSGFFGRQYGSYSSAVSVTLKPLAPKGLKASQASFSSIKLTWTKAAGSTGYEVEQYKGKKWVNISKKITKTTYTFSKATPQTSYKFRVRSYAKVGKKVIYSAYSSSISAKTTIPSPTGLSSSATKDSVKLTWKKVAGAKSYTVYSVNGSKYTKLASTTALNYTVKKLKANTSYKYAIKAAATVSKKTYYSAYSSALTTRTAAAAVTGLSSSAVTDSSIALKWNAVSGATGYQVYILKGSSWTLLQTVKTNKATASKLASLTDYSFKVRAYSTVSAVNVYGDYSAVFTCKTNPSPVKNLTVESADETELTLSWAQYKGATDYVLEMSNDGKSWSKVDLSAGLSTKNSKVYFTVAGLQKCSAQSFRVYAVCGSVKTPYSNVCIGKTTPAEVTDLAISTPSSTSVELSWSAVPGADGYIVRKGGTAVKSVTEPSCVLTVAKGASVYGYTVEAYVLADKKKISGDPSLPTAISSRVIAFNDDASIHQITWDEIPEAVYKIERFDEKENKWVVEREKTSGKISYCTVSRYVENVKYKASGDYVSVLSWSEYPNADAYIVKTSFDSTGAANRYQTVATSAKPTVSLRFAPGSDMCVTVSAVGTAKYRVTPISADDGTALAASSITSAKLITAKSDLFKFKTAPAKPFSASSNESKLAYTLKLVQAINNTKYEQDRVQVTRNEEFNADLNKATLDGRDIQGLLDIVGTITGEDLQGELIESFRGKTEAVGNFEYGIGSYIETSYEGNEAITGPARSKLLSDFVNPRDEDGAYLYDAQNLDTFSKRIASVAVNGKEITIELNGEKISSNNSKSGTPVHDGLTNTMANDFSQDEMMKDGSWSYLAGGSYDKKGNDVMSKTKIKAVINDDYTLDSLEIVSPFAMTLKGKISDQPIKIGLLTLDPDIEIKMSGSSTCKYQFSR